jgi:bacterioferritin (cytochrome b1)
MPDRDPMDEDAAVEKLNAALTLQYRSALSYTLLAGSLTGFSFQPLALELGRFAREEVDDARHLIEKIATLGREPTTDVAPLSFDKDPEKAIAQLIAEETDTIEALQAVIPTTGQEGRSEALEHRLEHMIMRKQEQVDALIRARGGPA